MTHLAADIGGTHSRIALIDGERVDIFHYRNSEFADFYQVVDRVVEQSDIGTASFQRCAIALPAPIGDGPVQLTNIDWTVDAQQLQRRHASRQWLLLNDFQAAAVGAIAYPTPTALNPLATSCGAGPAVVTGAGTGLGLAWLADVANPVLPHATEGGHADFAATDPQQRDLQAWLAQRHGGHVSYERVLSGNGLAAIYQFLSEAGEPIAADQVAGAAAAGDVTAVEAVRLFVRIFGAYVGSLALLFNPCAGIYLCGGVTCHLADWFDDEFRTAFYNKGRMRRKVESVPVYLVNDADIGLHGAIKIARDEYST